MTKQKAIDSPSEMDWSVPDWDREKPTTFWDPSRKLIKSIRDYQSIQASKMPFKRILLKYAVIRHMFWSMVTGAEIHLSCQIGGGLLIPHPNGIVIHPDSKIGPNCLIFQQVTLATFVELGYHVDIGAGAKILGPLTIGNNVQVGANAVVTKDIADGKTVVGIPARSLN